MVRSLSPYSADIAGDLIGQSYRANDITDTINHIRAHSARPLPVDPSPYSVNDVRALELTRFRGHLSF